MIKIYTEAELKDKFDITIKDIEKDGRGWDYNPEYLDEVLAANEGDEQALVLTNDGSRLWEILT